MVSMLKAAFNMEPELRHVKGTIRAGREITGQAPQRRCLRVDDHAHAEQPMTRVFIGGSRRISRLSDAVRGRLARVAEKGIPVLIGDASGAAKAVQRYLQERAYERVEVFSSDPSPRNNIGGWPVRVVRPTHTRRDFDYYATKDRAMAAEATVGLMLWDGESRGTLLNVLRLLGQHKPVVVFIDSKQAFTDIRNEADFDTLVAGLEQSAAKKLHEVAAAEGFQPGKGLPAQLRL